MNRPRSTNSAALTALKNSAWFRGLDNHLLAEIAGLSVIRTFAAGEMLFQQHEPGDYLFGVISGQIRISVNSSEGKELALNTLGPGDVGGEIAVLDGGPRTATGRALNKTTAFVVPREKFTELLLRQPKISVYLIRILCERVRRASQQVEDTAFLSVPQRIAGHLHMQVLASGGELPCRVKISQTELALFLNVTRQVVNKSLQVMQRQGFVSLNRGSIDVLDLREMLNFEPN
jgi:CRP-like cAMP-binding protein